MLALLLGYLRNNWLYVLIVSLVTAVTATFYIQRLEIDHLKREVEEFRATTATLESSNKSLLASLNNQNEAIAAMQALSAAKAKEASHALGIAQANAKKYALRAAQIEAQKTSDDACADIRALVDDFVK